MIFAFFPIIAAMCYGLAYAMTEKALKITNVGTYMTVNTLFGVIIILYLFTIKGEPLKIDFTTSPKDLWFILLSTAMPSIGWVFTMFAVKNTSAVYTSFAEISFPLFTLLFMFLLFGLRSIDWTILIGGGLIMTGSLIMIYGQTKGFGKG